MKRLAFCIAAVLLLVISAGARTWTDSTGKHKREAEFLDFKNGMVRLKLDDGNITSIQLQHLSKEDQEFVKFSIELPSGTTFTSSMTQTPDNWLDENFPRDAPIYWATYPNGKLQGAYQFKDGKLHGPAAGIYESGGRGVLANYYMSQRDGRLLRWEENGQRRLYAQYTRGTRTGLVCLFRGGSPWLLQEWDKGSLADEYLVKSSGAGLQAVSGKTLKGNDATELSIAQKKLAEVETEMDEGEAKLKKALRDWYREEDLRIRRERAAVAGVKKRRSIGQKTAGKRGRTVAGVASTMERRRRALQQAGY